MGSPRAGPALLAAACALAAAACAPRGAVPAPRRIAGVETPELVARLTGPEGSGSINPTWKVGIRGTDLGHFAEDGDKTWVIFGDTYAGDSPESEEWRWNAFARTSDADPRDGLTLDEWIVDGRGHARALIEDREAAPITNIPTGAIAIDGRLHVWYMAMSFWGTAEEPCWRAHWSGLAVSGAEGEAFEIRRDHRFAAGSNFGMVAAARGNADPQLAHEDFVYVWGTPTSRCGAVRVARVPAKLVDRREEWRFFAGMRGGEPTWSIAEESAIDVVPRQVGELSVMWNPWARSWIMLATAFDADANPMATGARIDFRQSPTPWGPWSEPITAIPPRFLGGGIYGSYMCPRYVEDDGRVVYATVSAWGPYDVYWVRLTLEDGTRGEEASTQMNADERR